MVRKAKTAAPHLFFSKNVFKWELTWGISFFSYFTIPNAPVIEFLMKRPMFLCKMLRRIQNRGHLKRKTASKRFKTQKTKAKKFFSSKKTTKLIQILRLLPTKRIFDSLQSQKSIQLTILLQETTV